MEISGHARALSRALRRQRRALVEGALSIAAATVAAAFAEGWVGVADALPLYLLAVVAMAVRSGTWPAVATSLVSFVVYDLLFTEPRFALQVSDPLEWLSLLLFLVVAFVVGHLAGTEAERAAEARARAAEAEALYDISRRLAAHGSVAEAASVIVERLRADSDARRVWLETASHGRELTLADTEPGSPRPAPATFAWAYQPGGADGQGGWVRTHRGVGQARTAEGTGGSVCRVPLGVDGHAYGSLWLLRDEAQGPPSPQQTRLLALTADQLALALQREALIEEATRAEVARRSDSLRSALIDSVSHELRTPLASIRALAGGLTDEEVTPDLDAIRRAAGEIDAQASRLADMVRDLLDVSRIEAAALRPELEAHDLADLVAGSLERRSALLESAVVEVDLPADLPPVTVDALFLDQVMGIILANSVRHAGPEARIRLAGRSLPGDPARLEILVEDDGPGVPDQDLEPIFGKFYRSRRAARDRRPGLGIGLTIARGLVGAMGGMIAAERGSLGGLALRIRLPAAEPAVGVDEP